MASEIRLPQFLAKRIGDSINADNFVLGEVIKRSKYEIVRIINDGYLIKETFLNFKEIDILARMNHNNIVKLETFFMDKSFEFSNRNRSLYIIMKSEPVTNSNNTNKDIIIGIISAVFHLHDNGIIHCNISPSKFLHSSDGHIKLWDFSSSTYHNRPVQKCINLLYSPPEALVRHYHYNIQTRYKYSSMLSVDLWSLGCTILFYLINKNPFGDNKVTLTNNMNLFLQNPTQYLTEQGIKESNIKLLLLLLDPNPEQRVQHIPIIKTMFGITSSEINHLPVHYLCYGNDELERINERSKLLIYNLFKFNFDTEVVFLTLDLYYRCVTFSYDIVNDKNCIFACLFLAYQLGMNNGKNNLQLISCLQENGCSKSEVIYNALYIAHVLHGYIYPNNLYTGVNDPNTLYSRINLLFSYDEYKDNIVRLSLPHSISKIRIPISLLITFE